jgi:hypothetical protein
MWLADRSFETPECKIVVRPICDRELFGSSRYSRRSNRRLYCSATFWLRMTIVARRVQGPTLPELRGGFVVWESRAVGATCSGLLSSGTRELQLGSEHR